MTTFTRRKLRTSLCLSLTPAGGTPEEFSKSLSSALTRWSEVARTAGIKAAK